MEIENELKAFPPTQVFAVVKNVFNSGGIAVVVFEDMEENQFRLFGDRRLVESLVDYVGDEVKLFIRHATDWSWLPSREFAKAC